MPRLLATLLIAVMVVANAMAHVSLVATYAAPASQAPIEVLAVASSDIGPSQLIGLSGATHALQSETIGCAQSSAAFNCAFMAVMSQHHSATRDIGDRAMLAVAEDKTLASASLPLLLRPPISFS